MKYFGKRSTHSDFVAGTTKARKNTGPSLHTNGKPPLIARPTMLRSRRGRRNRSALERINERLDSLEASVRADIAGIRGEIGGIRGDIGGIHGDIGGIHDDIGGIRGDIAGLRDDIADARRHATMLNESTRDDVRLVAEAVALLTIKVDALIRR
jgi:hypothetical protein